MIRILICEDDKLSCEENKKRVKELADRFKIQVIICAVIDSKAVPDEVFDIAFLDIDMGEENGIVIAKRLLKRNKAIPIIFITSHGEYALDACKIQCFGYILKPVDKAILEQLFVKAIIQVKSIRNRSLDEQISIYVDRKQISIRQKEILYVERIQRKIEIVTLKKSYCTNESLNTISQRLEQNFLQISQSVIVNAMEVQSVEGNLF